MHDAAPLFSDAPVRGSGVGVTSVVMRGGSACMMRRPSSLMGPATGGVPCCDESDHGAMTCRALSFSFDVFMFI